MSFGPDHQDMSLERDALTARIDPDSLLANPALWDSVEADFRRLRDRYVNAYIAHHARYNGEALERFNEMPELGGPVGTEVPELLREMTGVLKTCAKGSEDPPLDTTPYCSGCRLLLDDRFPRREAALLSGATARAMREYNRRLSSHAARQMLAHPSKEQLDKFVGLVQVADPSALANVLDDSVVEFLRGFLRQPGPPAR